LVRAPGVVAQVIVPAQQRPVALLKGAALGVVGLRRLGTVGIADQLEAAVAGVDALLEPGAQLAVAGGEVVLGDGVIAELVQSAGGQAPCRARH